jgi:hypothetical protein
MEKTEIRAVELVRAIRDQLYEETKELSAEEFQAFIAREARRGAKPTSGKPSGQSAA